MGKRWKRREVLQGLAAASGAALVPGAVADAATTFGLGRGPRETGTSAAARESASQDLEVRITPVSEHTFRLSILPVVNGTVATIRMNGSLARESWGESVARMRGEFQAQKVKCGSLAITISPEPLAFAITNAENEAIQTLTIERISGAVSFATGEAPLLGLGEGGPQFDRRGSADKMISGQGGYQLATHGGRVPIPWIIGTAGWAMYVHQPFGTFDLTGATSKYEAKNPSEAFPLDLFFVAAKDPKAIMAEYARITGHAELPPLWSFGYQQSHRTLGAEEDVINEAKTFREKKLACDTMIYLGTGFCPNGWNTENGSFVWNKRVFPEPKRALDALHKENFRVVVHAVILSDKLHGTVHDPCDLSRFDETSASCYWDTHRRDFAMGIDGWWPDEGDPMDLESRLARNRMYWEGPQLDRPNERPFALHRNGYAGMQRYASFLWSGDVASTWETLKTHIPVAINTALTGIPYWGTDIGGFVPTKEFTAELYLRWFQFGAFCPLFRCHGRTWKLRLPWGWNTGDPGPVEISNYRGAATPDASELHNPEVERICRKYLELRYRMLPYLYSAVRECTRTGVPVMRALWLEFPEDTRAVACGNQYLWGKSVMVAPIVEKGATSRTVYLPKGDWFDFWTDEKVEGEREVSKAVDLETMPLYVRGGSVLPLGPVKQYADEKVDEPSSIAIYPGRDGSFLLYEDDGKSFNHRRGEWMGIEMAWNDEQRKLTMRLAEGSRILAPLKTNFSVQLGQEKKAVEFEGKPVTVSF